jgi:integrase
MLWTDIVDGVWNVRRSPGEKHTPKALPLPPLALAILEKQDRRSARVWSLSVHHSKYKAALDAACALDEPWRVHDLRRTCRTVLANLGVPYDIGEAVLGHAVGSAVSRIYNRGDMTPHIGAALQQVADHISKLTSPPANVVPLAGVA